MIYIIYKGCCNGPEISPEMHIYFEGEKGVISCSIPDSSWKKRPGYISANAVISEGRITIYDLNVRDTGEYFCFQQGGFHKSRKASAMVKVGSELVFLPCT